MHPSYVYLQGIHGVHWQLIPDQVQVHHWHPLVAMKLSPIL